MQTLTIKKEDDIVAEVMNAPEQLKDNIQISKDKNLELDPYFDERQNRLHRILNKEPSNLTDFEDFEIKMDILEKELEETYAN
ncbi:MAG TPA: hypothetical protein ENL00_04735 [Nitratifractor sp.]|nr:hypothetical protein [Nitratifractor sp.]